MGLPNVGKSTLFNTLTKMGIPADNFPFCTIDPNNVRVHLSPLRRRPTLSCLSPCSQPPLTLIPALRPAQARVNVPDERFNWLCDLYKPKSEVPAFLEICDIAGLVKGAANGEGLGNAFLSHIMVRGLLEKHITLFV